MKITQEIRAFADKGMLDMSDKFRETGAEIYQPADEIEAAKVDAAD